MEQAAPSGVRPASAAPRLAQLDVLRAVAIFLVIGHHAAVDREQAGVLWPLYVWFKNFGWTGVDLFFVLSGFLIGGLLFRELRTRHTLDVRRFLLRRGFKIWPAYYVYLAFCLAVLVGLGHHGIGQALRLLGPNLVHLQNYSSILLDPHAKGLLPLTSHTWTLAIEEHFYLALALFLGLITRRQRTFDAGLPLVPVAAAVVMLGCLAARIWLVWGAAVTDVYYLYRPTHLRADSLFCGVAIAYIYHFHPDRFAAVARHRKLLLIVGTLLLVPTSLLGIHSRAVLTLGFTALYLGYACWLVVVVTSPLHSGRVGRFLAGRLGRLLARIGFYSYSIYLWHFCLRWPYSVAVREAQQRLAGVPLEATWLLFVALYAVASVAVGIVAALVVEGPFLRLRDRVAPSRSAALPPPQESGETAAG